MALGWGYLIFPLLRGKNKEKNILKSKLSESHITGLGHAMLVVGIKCPFNEWQGKAAQTKHTQHNKTCPTCNKRVTSLLCIFLFTFLKQKN